MNNVQLVQGAIAIIYRETPRGRIYLITHNIFSGNYTFPGCACEDQEKPIDAIKRIVSDELNIQPKDDQIEELPLTNSFMFSIPGSPGFKQPAKYNVFIIKTDIDDIAPNKKFVSRVHWLPYEQAKEMVKHEILKLNLDWIERRLS